MNADVEVCFSNFVNNLNAYASKELIMTTTNVMIKEIAITLIDEKENENSLLFMASFF